jgi:phage terminase large subunit-like protein
MQTALQRLPKRKAVEANQEFYYDEDKASHVLQFFETCLVHSKGKFAGNRFVPLGWQKELLENIFGWQRVDNDTRRYRMAYVSTAKKSGKSTLLAGIGLYLLCVDGEKGAEVYGAGADREQASLCFKEAAQMVRHSPILSQDLEIVDSRKTIAYKNEASFYRVLSADAFRAEGLNIHGLLFDELHAQRDRRLFDSLRYGGAARAQPLLCSITTAGYDKNSICYEQYTYAKQVLNDWTFDPTFYPCIHEIASDDDWADEEAWPKANPSWGVTIDPVGFKNDYKEAKASNSKENAFRRYRLNQWTDQDTRWLKMDQWEQGNLPPNNDLSGRTCFVGIDLASTWDMSAAVFLFPDEDGTYDVMCRFWMPEDNLKEKEQKTRLPYTTWLKDKSTGFKTTPGDVTDYEFIRKEMNELNEKYAIKKVLIDRWNATQFSVNLAGDGFDVLGYSQSFATMTAPTKLLENLVISGKIRHNGNKILTSMAGAVAVKTDPSGNIRPVKPKHNAGQKIDGIVALIMALGGHSKEVVVPDKTPEIIVL